MTREHSNMVHGGIFNRGRSDSERMERPGSSAPGDRCEGRWRVPRRILSSWQRRKSQIRTVPSSEQVANLLSVGEKLDQTNLESVTAAASLTSSLSAVTHRM